MFLNAIGATNLWAIFAAAAANFLIAGVYFGALTPKYYEIALGREGLPPNKPTALVILGPFLCNLVMIISTAAIMELVGIKTAGDALSLGELIGVGYLLPMCMTIAINPNFPRPFYYTVLNAPYFLVSTLVTSALLFVLR